MPNKTIVFCKRDKKTLETFFEVFDENIDDNLLKKIKSNEMRIKLNDDEISFLLEYLKNKINFLTSQNDIIKNDDSRSQILNLFIGKMATEFIDNSKLLINKLEKL